MGPAIERWSFAEYLFVDLGSPTLSANGSDNFGNFSPGIRLTDLKLQYHVARAAVNYRFAP